MDGVVATPASGTWSDGLRGFFVNQRLYPVRRTPVALGTEFVIYAMVIRLHIYRMSTPKAICTSRFRF